MDEVIPGLWIGDLRSALNAAGLKAHGIYSILSAMRGKITIHETFIRHQIQIDDTEDADILTHFLPCIHFIQSEIDKGRGVLVHCQAGVSRSSTIVAAYLMYSQKLDPQAALDLIKNSRPYVEPNQGFLQQLELFHDARYKISRREKAIRMFYLDRTVGEVMNGDGSPPQTEMFAKYPRTPSDSLPNTPGGGPRRRIRCKMCRQELATREHMLDHGQLGPPTPAANTPAGSRRPSASGGDNIRRPSRPSFGTALGDSLAMSSIDENTVKLTESPKKVNSSDSIERCVPMIPETHPLRSFRSSSQYLDRTESLSALEIEGEGDHEPNGAQDAHPDHINLTGVTPEDMSIQAAQMIGLKLSEAVISTPRGGDKPNGKQAETEGLFFTEKEGTINEYRSSSPTTTIDQPVTQFISPSDLAVQLISNPKLAALRSPTLPTSPSHGSPFKPMLQYSSPILVNPKCSGYFVEPMKWMDHFLTDGQLAGKIICPNKKCGAKLGNYDWAGQCCGCKEWVTPGFCINRSKVDEVV
ncbi:hypothetical protein BDN70DRAFT_938587 [Pholiota conissans]|uniref:protein-tyrosine-phosphatase n=1 Tax=Pholiota conissans TaxID=109636 RepID=A0A9P5YNL6_9AGAR|nr:hypothetical protein BDN70DRAFT_938587 [Pholiota conissans]